MPDPTTPYVELSNAVKVAIDAEFLTEGYVTKHDNLHEAVGMDKTVVGIAPADEIPRSSNLILQEASLIVKWYGKYDKDVNPLQSVDPRPITVKAERFRRAMESATFTGGPLLWYFRVVRVSYPDDPTGNKTRFVATVLSHSQNSGLVETTA